MGKKKAGKGWRRHRVVALGCCSVAASLTAISTVSPPAQAAVMLGPIVQASIAGTVDNSRNMMANEATVDGSGRYVAFQSWTQDHASGDTNDYYDIYVRDLKAG